MSNKTPPAFVVDATDHGGVAVIVSTLLMTWSVLCFMIRIYTRQGTSNLSVDDWLCLSATVIAILQTIVTCVGVDAGLGKAQSLLSASQLTTVEKYAYAVVLLCILVIYLTKASMLFFHLRITPRKDHQKVVCGLLALVSGVGIASFILEAARCDATTPWNIFTRQCPDYKPIWAAVAAMDMATEILLFAMPIWIVWDLQMIASTKILICATFALRLPVIAAAGAHLWHVDHFLNSSRPTVTYIIPFIILQIETHYATISCTFPCLGPFMKNLNTRMGTMGPEEAGAYALESTRSAGSASRKFGSRATDPNGSVQSGPADTGYSFRIQKRGAGGAGEKLSSAPHRSRGSDDSGRMIIHKTTDTTIEFDE